MDKHPCGSILEASHFKGMITGLVVTSRISHATPASFSSHVSLRDSEDEIAGQQIGMGKLGRVVDLLYGGGKWNSSSHSCRDDDLDLLQLAGEMGWNIGDGINHFRDYNNYTDRRDNQGSHKLPLINLFSDNHMDYEIDRDPTTQPSLTEMATQALEILNENVAKSKAPGFFLLIEGSRIDMAAHRYLFLRSNDPAAHVHEILEYNRAIKAVQDFILLNPDTLLVSVSDHETGGLSVAHQLGQSYPEYRWYPHHLAPIKHSGEYMSRMIIDQPIESRRAFIIREMEGWIGVTLSEDQIQYLIQPSLKASDIDFYLSSLTSNLAGLGWATHGHSAVDVNLYAFGAGAQVFRGNIENTEVGGRVQTLFGLDLQSVTDRLNKS